MSDRFSTPRSGRNMRSAFRPHFLDSRSIRNARPSVKGQKRQFDCQHLNLSPSIHLLFSSHLTFSPHSTLHSRRKGKEQKTRKGNNPPVSFCFLPRNAVYKVDDDLRNVGLPPLRTAEGFFLRNLLPDCHRRLLSALRKERYTL